MRLIITYLLTLFLFGALASGWCVVPVFANDTRNFAARVNLDIVDEKGSPVEISVSDIKLFENDIEQPVTYLRKKTPPLFVSLVFDNSGSVRKQLDQVMSLGKQIATNLSPEDFANVIRFTGRDTIEVSQPWTHKQPDLIEAIKDMYVDYGQSSVFDALYLSGQDIIKRRKAADDHRYAIVLVSDGEDRNSYYTQKDVVKLLSDQDIQIFTIALTKDLPERIGWFGNLHRRSAAAVERSVNTIAAKTGGTSIILSDKATPADYTEAVKFLMTELRSPYIVGYIAKDLKNDNLFRKLTVTIADGPNGEKRKAIVKEIIALPRD
jgi:VWFA-related protein